MTSRLNIAILRRKLIMKDPIIQIVQALIVAAALVVSVFLVVNQLEKGEIGRFRGILKDTCVLDTKTGDVWRLRGKNRGSRILGPLK